MSTTQAQTPAAPAGRVMLKDVRLSFPNLFKATKVGSDPNAEPRFSANFLIEPGSDLHKLCEAKIEAVGKEKWGKDWTAQKNAMEKKDRIALHDGDLKPNYEGYPGNLFLTATAKANSKPTVIDANKEPLAESSGRPYSGCYVNASVEFWAQESKDWGNRINCTLRGVQFNRDGDAFSGSAPASTDEFDAVEGAEASDFA